MAQREAPRVVLDADGRVVAEERIGLPGDNLVFDSRSTPLSWIRETAPPLDRRFLGHPFDLRPATLTLLGGDVFHPLGWYDQASRRFHAYEWQGTRAVALHRLGLGPEAGPLPAGSVPIFGSEATTATFVDPASGQAWVLHRTPDGVPRLDVAPLPDGQRLVGIERVHWLRRARAGLYEPYGVSDELVVRGDAGGLWTRGPDGWTPYVPEDDDVLESEFDAVVRLRLVPTGDALHPRVQVRDAQTSDLLLEADVTAPGTANALLSQGLAAARPPLFAAVAALRPPGVPEERAWALDPLARDVALDGGARPWLLLAGLALSALLVLCVRPYLGRAPGERGLRAGWSVAVLLLGLPALIAMSFVEPPRRAAPRS
jgi:hypothetical protein